MSRIPLYLFHGTLGSGKTTVLKELLKTAPFRGSFIIENEFAPENIDQLTLAEDTHDSELAAITGGCVCCSSEEDLEKVLAAIAEKKWAKPVIIETTGVASAAELLTKLYLSPTFVLQFELKHSVFVLDPLVVSVEDVSAKRKADILSSDIVVVHKIDKIGPERVATYQDSVENLLGPGSVWAVERGRAPWEKLAEASSSAVERRLAAILALPRAAAHAVRYAIHYPSHAASRAALEDAVRAMLSDAATRPDRLKGYLPLVDGTMAHLEATANHYDIDITTRSVKAVVVALGPSVTPELIQRFFP